MGNPVDLLVIGGGINGTGIARDAAGRGLSVVLCEKEDLAQHTSSASTKLIHGGLRYLEHYEFKLVRESLIEREILLRSAPHIIWPLRFVLPHHKGLRPAWLLRLGLFLYDNLGGRKLLPPTKTRRFEPDNGLKKEFTLGFEYSDCWVEDARLVVLNAVDARKRGADIRTRTLCTSIRREDGIWHAALEDGPGNAETIKARAVVNAAGPWVDEVIRSSQPGQTRNNLRLVKGSHIVTRKLYDGDHAYILQHSDNRIIFTIPYEGNYTLIGTTDISYEGNQGPVEISNEEINYLCTLVSEYFEKPVAANDIKWTYSGVRPLFDDQEDNASVVTRDYVFDLDAPEAQAPLLSVFGGKITTYRKLSEQAVDRLCALLQTPKPAWTKKASLPGGDIPDADFNGFVEGTQKSFPLLPQSILTRLCRAYGTRVEELLRDKKSLRDMGNQFGAGLSECEVDWLVQEELAQSADDILWRRSKLGLHMTRAERKIFADWFDAKYNFTPSLQNRAEESTSQRTREIPVEGEKLHQIAP